MDELQKRTVRVLPETIERAKAAKKAYRVQIQNIGQALDLAIKEFIQNHRIPYRNF